VLQQCWGPGPLGKVPLASTHTYTVLQCLPCWDELHSRPL
jgi:hypothetical protein